MRILDFHNHIGRSVDIRISQSADELLDEMDKFGIELAVAFPFFEQKRGLDYTGPNSIIRTAARTNSRLIPFARLDPANLEPTLEEAARSFANGSRGFKIHTQSDQFTFQQLRALLDNIEHYRLPIIIHYWDNLNRAWIEIFRNYSNTRFIIAHCGGMRHSPIAAKLARSLDNIYLETSGILFLFNAFVLSTAPMHKILFGSDSPFSHPYIEAKKIALVIPEKQQRMVFWDNAARLLNL